MGVSMSDSSSKPVTRLCLLQGVKIGTPNADARKLAAARLRRARCSVGLSQEEAARRLGVSVRSYGSWERGAVPLRPLEALIVLETFEGKKAA
jgi:DNA-binding transcriptional regulator YiaG